MGDLSKHFSRHEFACPCGCGFQAVDAELLRVLQDLRESMTRIVKISSGCRCPSYNQKIGGERDSQHIFGMASDIVIPTGRLERVADYLEKQYPDRYGIGRYDRHIHLDVKPGPPRRWKGVSK